MGGGQGERGWGRGERKGMGMGRERGRERGREGRKETEMGGREGNGREEGRGGRGRGVSFLRRRGKSLNSPPTPPFSIPIPFPFPHPPPNIQQKPRDPHFFFPPPPPPHPIFHKDNLFLSPCFGERGRGALLNENGGERKGGWVRYHIGSQVKNGGWA